MPPASPQALWRVSRQNPTEWVPNPRVTPVFDYGGGLPVRSDFEAHHRRNQRVLIASRPMNWPEFIAEVVGHLAWPATAMVVLFVFRSPLANLIERLRHVKFQSLELEAGLTEVIVKSPDVEATPEIASRYASRAAEVVRSLAQEDAGVPATIDSDAPDYVDPLSETLVTVTVLDEEGVRVRAVPIDIGMVEGDGLFVDRSGSYTSDGRATFSYLAPVSAGEAVFVVQAGDASKGQQIQGIIELAISPEPPPETWNARLKDGSQTVVWNGEDGAAPSEGVVPGVVAIWHWNGSSWDCYFPDAADVPGGVTLPSLTNGAAYLVVVEGR